MHSSQEIVVMSPEKVFNMITSAVRQALGDSAIPEEARELEVLKRKETLTTEEVAKLYGLNVSTLCKWRTNGEGPSYVKSGDRVFYTHLAVKKYLEARMQKTIDQP